MERSGDVRLVTLRLLAHVENLHGSVFEQPLELAELDRLRALGRVDARHVARELEEADRAQAACGAFPFRVVGRVQHDALSRIEDETGARRER